MTHNPLIQPAELAEQLGSPKLVILDATFFLPAQARNAVEEYQQAHIPGAHFFDIDQIADRANPLPRMLPSASQFEQTVGQLGIDNQSTVVIYDNNRLIAAARAWWMFRYFGHHTVRILDGGLVQWRANSGSTDAEVTHPTPRTFSATSNTSLVYTLEQTAEASLSASRQILDARSAARFSGEAAETRPGQRSGHIPGSHNLPHANLTDPVSQQLCSVIELEKRYRNAAIDTTQPIVTTCGSGVTAAILALGLYRLGKADVPVYDGSWSEWGGRLDKPIEIGDYRP